MKPTSITVPIILTAKDEPNQPPPAIRLRRWLKAGLRIYGIKASWAPTAPKPKTEAL